MECLLGRKVQYVYGPKYGAEEGVVVQERGKEVVILLDDTTVKYHAKWRLLTAEYPWAEVPEAVGVYLIAEGV